MIRETGHVATDGPGKRGQPPGSGHGSDGSTKGGRDKGAIDSQPRLCVGSMEHKDGSLNRQVKTKDPGLPGSVRQRARKLCSPSRKCIFSLQPRSPLPAAAPAPSSLLRGACADKTPFVRATGSQDTVTSCVDGKQ